VLAHGLTVTDVTDRVTRQSQPGVRAALWRDGFLTAAPRFLTTS
jgi:hypothetical protein